MHFRRCTFFSIPGWLKSVICDGHQNDAGFLLLSPTDPFLIEGTDPWGGKWLSMAVTFSQH